MIKIHPFVAYLPPSQHAAEIACEPYDVISTAEARIAAWDKPASFLRVVRSEIGFDQQVDPYDAQVYQAARANLDRMISDGNLIEQPEATLYLYRQVMNGRSQTGVVCCYDVEQYRSDQIKKHEKTRPVKEDDRTRHLTTCSAHAEPVFLTFNSPGEIIELIEVDSAAEPLIDFVTSDGVQHSIWRVANPDAYVSSFRDVESAYIADGHHRTAAGERAATQRQRENPNHSGNEEYNRILAVMFPASQLEILAYNRIVKDLNGLTCQQVIEALEGVGEVVETDNPVPDRAGNICVFLNNLWYRFSFTSDTIDHQDPIKSLDVALLQDRILTPILGVGDPRTDGRVDFVGGIRGTQELEKRVQSGRAAIAFSMFPTSLEQLIRASDEGQVMPPKSTWFEPKLRSGLFVHRFEEYT